jgi:hypothetical protein
MKYNKLDQSNKQGSFISNSVSLIVLYVFFSILFLVLLSIRNNDFIQIEYLISGVLLVSSFWTCRYLNQNFSLIALMSNYKNGLLIGVVYFAFNAIYIGNIRESYSSIFFCFSVFSFAIYFISIQKVIDVNYIRVVSLYGTLIFILIDLFVIANSHTLTFNGLAPNVVLNTQLRLPFLIVALIMCYKKYGLKFSSNSIFSLIILLLSVIIIFLTKNRVSIFIVTSIIIYLFFISKKYVFSGIFLLIGVLSLVYISSDSLKSGSLYGRFFLWGLSSNIFSKNYLFGIGFNQFQQFIGLEQISFFKVYSTGNFSKNFSENYIYAYNDSLQLICEFGIIGLILFMFILYRNKLVPKIFHSTLEVKFLLLSFFLTSLTSYQIYDSNSLIFYILFLVFRSELRFDNYLVAAKQFIKCVETSLVFTLSCFCFIHFWFTINWYASKDSTIEKNQLSEYFLQDYGFYNYNLGARFYKESDLNYSYSFLVRANDIYTNSDILIYLGNIAMDKEQYSLADSIYHEAYFLSPSKFIPRFKIARLSLKIKDTSRSIVYLNSIVQDSLTIKNGIMQKIFIDSKQILLTLKK